MKNNISCCFCKKAYNLNSNLTHMTVLLSLFAVFVVITITGVVLVNRPEVESYENIWGAMFLVGAAVSAVLLVIIFLYGIYLLVF